MMLAHVTIFTKCLRESIDFYEKMVGLEIQKDLREQGLSIVFMGETDGSTLIELVEKPADAYYGGGLLLGFEVEDAQAERRKKEEAGLRPGPMVWPNAHTLFFTVKDPNGVEIQFVQEE